MFGYSGELNPYDVALMFLDNGIDPFDETWAEDDDWMKAAAKRYAQDQAKAAWLEAQQYSSRTFQDLDKGYVAPRGYEYEDWLQDNVTKGFGAEAGATIGAAVGGPLGAAIGAGGGYAAGKLNTAAKKQYKKFTYKANLHPNSWQDKAMNSRWTSSIPVVGPLATMGRLTSRRNAGKRYWKNQKRLLKQDAKRINHELARTGRLRL
jgi:hypothetical protein